MSKVNTNKFSVGNWNSIMLQRVSSRTIAGKHVIKSRTRTGTGLEDLIICGICQQKINDPRMLECQHTFCLECLKTHYTTGNMTIISGPSSTEIVDLTFDKHCEILKCPNCQKQTELDRGYDSIPNLRTNMHVESLLEFLEENDTSLVGASEFRCVKCQTVMPTAEQNCQHCLQDFCNVCWGDHVAELESSLENLTKQLSGCSVDLEYHMEQFNDRLDHLNISIKEASKSKIDAVKKLEAETMKELQELKNSRELEVEAMNGKLEQLIRRLSDKPLGLSNNLTHKDQKYLILHKETSNVLEEVSHMGEGGISFDAESFKLSQSIEGIYNEIELDIQEGENRIKNKYKKKDSTLPRLIWKKCPRPAHINSPFWDLTKLYIATTDNRSVLILSIDKLKLLGKLTHTDMLYPQSVAFSRSLEEIYVSDKWKHCIHVFSRSGEYLRAFGSKGMGKGNLKHPHGIALGLNEELIVCDSGNDRVVIFDVETGNQISQIGDTVLNMPLDVAVRGDNIIVLDSGNHRIKTYNLKGELLGEFGSFGQNKGQFKSAEVFTVDSSGFILVGDSGNARIQVFSPDGTLLKIFGGKHNSFQWVSGIYVSNEMDIIVTDSRAHSLRIF